ncbi:MAG: hypothetical protein Q8K55_14625 [Gemmatimonadaceae bacterium]|nr:hypothetical protein [Gemmatimonadaceae bacterium]
MQVLLKTDHSVSDFASLFTHVDGAVRHALDHHGDRITRLEVHLGDENGAKAGPDDKRCTMEARLEGRPPIAVTHYANTVESAVRGAARHMANAINRAIGRFVSSRPTRGHAAGA